MSDRRLYYVCKYTPVELMEALGADLRRLEPTVESFDCADSCSHPNLCGYGKGVIETAEREKIPALILTDCCDVMRRVYDVLKARGTVPFLYFLPLPHRQGQAQEKLFAQALDELIRAWNGYQKEPEENEIPEAVRTREEPVPAGSLEQRLTRRWSGERAQALKIRDAVKSRDYISLRGAHAGAALCGTVAGRFPVPVLNETCTGLRILPQPPQTQEGDNGGQTQSGSLLAQYAHALLAQAGPCMRMQDRPSERQENHEAGVIYHTIKFCDYYGFEYRDLRTALKVPILKIETDNTPLSSGQIRTRLDALSETLSCQHPEWGSVESPSDLNLAGKAAPFDPALAGDGQTGAKDRKHTAPDGQDLAVMPARAVYSSEEARPLSGVTESKMVNGTFYTAGVDSGSTSTDAVIMDREGHILGKAILPTGRGAAAGAQEALKEALDMAGVSRDDLSGIVMTGYGRETVGMKGKSVTEITCHAKGAHFLRPSARTVIDIGGQDSKVIRVDDQGNVENFVMNDKCAAGTGRFLEMMAAALGMSLDQMSHEGLKWKEDVRISSMCTVFAESEVVSLIAQNIAPADIIHGLNQSVAGKTASLAGRAGGKPEYIMTGGVSQNEGVVRALEDRLGAKIYVSEDSQLCGAIGAALLAMEGLSA